MEGLEGFAENVTTLEKLFDMALGKTLIAEVTPRYVNDANARHSVRFEI